MHVATGGVRGQVLAGSARVSPSAACDRGSMAPSSIETVAHLLASCMGLNHCGRSCCMAPVPPGGAGVL